MTGRALSAVVLAGGLGARMRSNRPKPLHLLCGRPMLLYVLDALAPLEVARTVVVVGPGAERITKRLSDEGHHLHLDFVEQPQARGSADAVAAALAALPEDDLGDDDVLVMAGDLPLLPAASVTGLLGHHRETDAACTLLVARAAPHEAVGRSRVIRGRRGTVTHVVRPEDLGDDDGGDEVAALVGVFRRSVLGPALRRLVPDAIDGEYRLFDVVEVLDRAGYPVGSFEVAATEVAAVDDRARLAEVEAEIRRRVNLGWLRAGVTFVDPATAYVDATVQLGRDVTIFPNTLLQGLTVVGEGAEVGPDTRLVDCVVGAGAHVERTSGRDAEIGPGADVGPFAVLEPGAQVPPGARVGPFTTFGEV